MLEFTSISSCKMTYDEAWLYCACLWYNNKSDWRMLTDDETDLQRIEDTEIWVEENLSYSKTANPILRFPVVPVRDAKISCIS